MNVPSIPRDQRHRWADAAAGILAVGVALGVAELLAGAVGRAASPVIAVGDVVVDRVPAAVKNVAISVFGTGDKVALIVGTLVLCAVAGAALGWQGRRRFPVAVAGFVVFGALGVAAATGDPRSSTPATLGTVGAGVAAGLVTLWLLYGASAAASTARTAHGRRHFLRVATRAAAVAVAAAWSGRWLSRRSVAALSREDLVVPVPRQTVAPPPATADLGIKGVEPWATSNDDFYRIDTALSVPRVDVGNWRLKVTGMVDRPLDWTFEELVAQGLQEQWTTLTCVSNEVGGRLIGNARWGGVPLRTVLDLAGVQLGATQIVGRSVDGWTAGFPTEAAYDGRDALIAVTMNGEALPIPHGFPARLVVPGLYGYVSATKWLSEIELTTWEAFDGYWVPRGWSKEGPVKTQSRIDVPGPGTIPAGRTPVAGVAWAQGRGIERVEVRVDEGEWREARLAAVPNVDTWRQWVWEWDATQGSHLLEVRATDAAGQPQTDRSQGVMPDGATGYHRVLVQVRA